MMMNNHSNNGHHDYHDESTNKTVKVCVIGAGFAGLSVAYHLLKHNEAAKDFDGSTYGSPLFDIEILEARDRIGGRVYPSNLGTGDAPIMVDMGAQWLHEAGPENPLVQLLQDLKIPLLYAQKEKEAEQQQQQQEGEENNSGEQNGNAANNNNTKKKVVVESGTYTIDGKKIPDDIFIAARNFYSKSKNNYKRKNITLNTSFQDLLNEAYQKKFSSIAAEQQNDDDKDKATTTEGEGEGGEEGDDDDEGYATAQSEVSEESDSSSSSSSSDDDDDEEEEDDDDEEEGEETIGETTDEDDSSSSSSSSSSEEDEDDEDDDEEEEGGEEEEAKKKKKKKDEKFRKCFSNPLFEQTVNYLVHSTECYEGGRLHEISVALSDMYQEYDGTDEIPVGGYHAVLQALQKYIFMNGENRQHCSIHLKCPVQDIYYESSPPPRRGRGRGGGSGGATTMDNNSEMTELTDDDDTADSTTTTKIISGVKIEYTNEGTSESSCTVQADCCVCTVPLGVLQRDIGFHPPLPLSQEQSIDMIGMGLLDKIMILFPYKFWDDDWFAGVTGGDDPTRIQNFQDVSEDYGGKPILASLLGGNVARRFDCIDDDEGLTDEEVMTEVMTTLRKLFHHGGGGGGESESGGDNHNVDGVVVVPDPISYQISRWLCDPYSYGSYSFSKVGSTPEDYDRVAQPAGKNLFFAGEHTSKYHHSTVHGAWESGHREAVRLILKAKAEAAARNI